jgi:hypothetical protein
MEEERRSHTFRFETGVQLLVLEIQSLAHNWNPRSDTPARPFCVA